MLIGIWRCRWGTVVSNKAVSVAKKGYKSAKGTVVWTWAGIILTFLFFRYSVCVKMQKRSMPVHFDPSSDKDNVQGCILHLSHCVLHSSLQLACPNQCWCSVLVPCSLVSISSFLLLNCVVSCVSCDLCTGPSWSTGTLLLPYLFAPTLNSTCQISREKTTCLRRSPSTRAKPQIRKSPTTYGINARLELWEVPNKKGRT